VRAALYFEDGRMQVALTPENDWEKTALKHIAEAKSVKTFWGGFYWCQGGWVRHECSDYKESLMLLLENERREATGR